MLPDFEPCPPGQLADLAVLSEDYFSVPEERIKQLESVLTLVGGKPVHATAEFKHLDPPPLPVSPDWSPVKHYGGYGSKVVAARSAALAHHSHPHAPWQDNHTASHALWGPLGCDCFAF